MPRTNLGISRLDVEFAKCLARIVTHLGTSNHQWLGPPVVPFYPFWGEGSPTNINHRKKRKEKKTRYPYSDLSTGGPRWALSTQTFSGAPLYCVLFEGSSSIKPFSAQTPARKTRPRGALFLPWPRKREGLASWGTRGLADDAGQLLGRRHWIWQLGLLFALDLDLSLTRPGARPDPDALVPLARPPGDG